MDMEWMSFRKHKTSGDGHVCYFASIKQVDIKWRTSRRNWMLFRKHKTSGDQVVSGEQVVTVVISHT